MPSHTCLTALWKSAVCQFEVSSTILRAYSSSSGSGSALQANLLAINRVKVGVMRRLQSLAGDSACSAETAEDNGLLSMLASVAAVRLAAARPGWPARPAADGIGKKMRWLGEFTLLHANAHTGYLIIPTNVWNMVHWN